MPRHCQGPVLGGDCYFGIDGRKAQLSFRHTRCVFCDWLRMDTGIATGACQSTIRIMIERMDDKIAAEAVELIPAAYRTAVLPWYQPGEAISASLRPRRLRTRQV